MKISGSNYFRNGIFAISSLAFVIGSAIATRSAEGAPLSLSKNNSASAEQISRAQNKVATALSIADRFAPEFSAGPNGTQDPKRIQLINNLLSGDARGLAEARDADSLQQALAISSSATIRKSNTTIAAGIAGISNPVTPNTIGDSAADLVYTPITPCRIADTRFIGASGSPFTDDSSKTFNAAGSAAQGDTTGCSGFSGAVPAAMVMNVTIDSTTMSGYSNSYMSVYPAGSSPLSSWLNYSSGQEIANEGVATLNVSGDFTVYAQSATHALVDAYGFFRAPSGGAGGPTSGGMAFTSSMTASPIVVVLGGLLNTGAAMPMSGAELATSPSVGLGPLNISTAPLLLPLVQTFPQSGTFTTLRATFMETAAVTLLSPTTLKATLYTGTPSGGPLTLTATGLTCSVNLATGIIAIGSTQTCSITNANVAVNAGDSGLIVVSATGALATVLTVGGSVAISP